MTQAQANGTWGRRMQRPPSGVDVVPETDAVQWPLAIARPKPIRRYWRRGLRSLKTFFENPNDIKHAFEFYYAMSQRDMETYFQRFVASPHGPRLLTEKPDLAAVVADVEALAAMPDGSLGRAYLGFLQSNGYQSLGILRLYQVIMQKWVDEVGLEMLDDDRMWFVNRYMVSHDLHHIVTGYGPDELGEAALSVFTLGQHYGGGLTVLTMGAVSYCAKELGLSWLHYAWRAFKRGRRARPLYAAPWEELLPLPLDLACELLSIQPIHEAHPNGIWAADFHPPHHDPYLLEGQGLDAASVIASSSSRAAGPAA